MAFVILVLIVALLLGIYLWDRKAKSRGQTLRSSSDMKRSERDVHRNIRAADSMFHNPQPGWDKPEDRRHGDSKR